MKTLRFLPLLLILFAGCKSDPQKENPVTAFIGATLIDGNGGEPILHGVLLVQDGKIIDIGTAEKISIPANAVTINTSGKTIIPGIINAHGHVGDVMGIEGGHYSYENVIDNLSLYARYGITTVVSLGGDKKEGEPLRAVHESEPVDRAHLFIAGDIINGKDPAAAMAVVDSNQHLGVDIMKIRVDDNLGSSPKMPEEIYRAAIKRAHELGYKVATHLYYLDDAKRLLHAGSDMMAHSVRDKLIDDEFLQLMKEKNVSYCPTLTRELSTFVYGDTAEFFSDPFFLKEYKADVFQPLLDPVRQKEMKNSKAAITYQQQLPTAMANLKTLADQGVPIVFGTDSGVPTRFIGYFEHVEMKMMADAGLTPMQIIVSATKNPAQYLGLKNVGTLSKGNSADFIVLNADPVADITNIRQIAYVYISGAKINR